MSPNDCTQCSHYALVWEGNTGGMRCQHPELVQRQAPTPDGQMASDHHLDLHAFAGGLCDWHDALTVHAILDAMSQ